MQYPALAMVSVLILCVNLPDLYLEDLFTPDKQL
jgi:hypothetical protein